MQKAALIKQISDALKASLRVLQEAARSSRAEATDESNRSENKYDTRSLEAGYLAQGQARQAQELIDAIETYEQLQPRAFPAGAPIELTAVVELEADGARARYFVGPRSGGLTVSFDGETYVVITPSSPLGQALMGKREGYAWATKRGGRLVKQRVLSVR